MDVPGLPGCLPASSSPPGPWHAAASWAVSAPAGHLSSAASTSSRCSATPPLRSRQPVPQVRDHRLQRRDLVRLRREPPLLLPEPLRLLPDQRITRIRRQLIRRRIGHDTRSSRNPRPALTATPHLTLKRNWRSHTCRGSAKTPLCAGFLPPG